MKHGLGQAAVALGEGFLLPDEEPCLSALESLNEEALEGHIALGIESLRRENEKFLEAEVAKWNALTPKESPFEWRGKSAAEILAWRNEKVKQVLGENAQRPQLLRQRNGPWLPPEGLQKTEETAPPSPQALANKPMSGPQSPVGVEPSAYRREQALASRRRKTEYEDKLARWKRAILKEKIIDLDDAVFEEKFAEWGTHALRLEAIKQDILRLEKKAIELKIEELREQAAKQWAELKAAEQKRNAE